MNIAEGKNRGSPPYPGASGKVSLTHLYFTLVKLRTLNVNASGPGVKKHILEKDVKALETQILPYFLFGQDFYTRMILKMSRRSAQSCLPRVSGQHPRK